MRNNIDETSLLLVGITCFKIFYRLLPGFMLFYTVLISKVCESMKLFCLSTLPIGFKKFTPLVFCKFCWTFKPGLFTTRSLFNFFFHIFFGCIHIFFTPKFLFFFLKFIIQSSEYLALFLVNIFVLECLMKSCSLY